MTPHDPGAKRRHSCICGNLTEGQPFSEHFEVHVCPACRTQQFHPKEGTVAPVFKYDERNDKYSDEAYLHGNELRWAHKELLKQDWRGRKVLEIGCFNGFFVDALRRSGASAYGVDVNSAALEAGMRLFGLSGHLLSELDMARQYAPFDDIVCVDVIEHVDNPDDFLAHVSRLLGSSGRIHVAGPTVERRFFDKSDHPPHHKWRFSRPGLARFLERGGFRPGSPVIQYDGLLMFRNWIGRLLHGYGRREFYGDVNFTPPNLRSGFAAILYQGASRIGEVLFRVLRISYCATIVSGQRSA